MNTPHPDDSRRFGTIPLSPSHGAGVMREINLTPDRPDTYRLFLVKRASVSQLLLAWRVPHSRDTPEVRIVLNTWRRSKNLPPLPLDEFPLSSSRGPYPLGEILDALNFTTHWPEDPAPQWRIATSTTAADFARAREYDVRALPMAIADHDHVTADAAITAALTSHRAAETVDDLGCGSV